MAGDGDDGSADISDALLYSFIFVVNVLLAFVVGFLGVVFNLINVVTFIKMGLSDNTNISLLSLAVADIGVSLTMIGYSVVYNPLILEATPIDLIRAVNYTIQGSCHILFSRIAGCLTAFITVERFLCIAFPLHVRAIVTPRRTSSVVVFIYAFLTVCTIPFYVANQIGQRYDQDSNRTTYGLVVAPNADHLEGFTLTVNSVAQMTSFALVVVSTLGLIRSLLKVSRWRSSASSCSSHQEVRVRENQLVKMTLLIAAVFIACSLPTVVGNLAMLFLKDFNIKGRSKNIFVFMFVIFFMLDSINSTINMFIYIKMSSKFKVQLISCCKRTMKQ
ncbi:unnamed protein product [Lymnaea stagnalis]|uniref:G-protein coupled receptors family 1 profile domain-containing protein n=1 Tax=Lymnaea stagnalis TaxID=6523 RepID=A0AAV2HVS9_LYMST